MARDTAEEGTAQGGVAFILTERGLGALLDLNLGTYAWHGESQLSFSNLTRELPPSDVSSTRSRFQNMNC